MQAGKAKYVTAVSQSDVAEGWREHRANGGCVIDVESNEIVLRGLSMPHSPRWHQEKLWLLNSGTGEFGFADLKRGVFEPIAFCPGYLRGCTFHGDFAVVGISQPRHNKTFSGLALDEKLHQKNVKPRHRQKRSEKSQIFFVTCHCKFSTGSWSNRRINSSKASWSGFCPS